MCRSGCVAACRLPRAAPHLLLLSGGPQVKPLRKQLKNYRAWITGQRKDQSPGTRMAVPVVQVCERRSEWLLALLGSA